MLKTPFFNKFTSVFHSLKGKGKRYYWVPQNPEEFNKITFIKQKYDVPKEVSELMEEQEKNIKTLNEQLTSLQINQKKVIEKIHVELLDFKNQYKSYSYNSQIIQTMTLFHVFLFLISNR